MATTPTAPVIDVPASPESGAESVLGRAVRAAVPTAVRRLFFRPGKSVGQSLAEFSLTVPMALFMVLFGLDFGRVFLGWVALNQAAREAANYAAMNPTAWTVPYDLTVQAEYSRLVQTEASNINCTLQSPVPSPTFASGTSIAAPASVSITCNFRLITPFITVILGNTIPVTASSAFPIRSGTIEGVPVQTTTPTASPAPTASSAPTATPAPTATAAPTATPAASATPTPTPTPTPTATTQMCTVPSLLGYSTNQAASKWKNPGFTGAVVFSPLVPPNYTINWQSLTVGTSQPCTSGITVRSSAP